MIKTFTRSLTLLLLGLSSTAVMAAEESYPINFDKDSKIAGTRTLNGLIFCSSDGDQYLAVDQADDLLLYHDLTNYCFTTVPGEKVVANFDWTGSWMHGYVYLDRANDGQFDAILSEDGTIPATSDVMAFSLYNGLNSEGRDTGNNNPGIEPPAFKLPDLKPGLYRMRYKIDWNSLDPGGNDENGVIHQQTIISNNGAIADVMLLVHDIQNDVTLVSEHGQVLNAKGESVQGSQAPTGESMKLVFVPDAGYCVSGVVVENGYNLTVPDGLSMAGGGSELTTTEFPANLIINNELTLPAKYTTGNVKITVSYLETGLDSGEDYFCTLSGSKAQNEGFTQVGVTSGTNGDIQSTASIESTTRHTFHSATVLHAQLGGDIVPTYQFEGESVPMHFYIDLNHDGAFVSALGEEVAQGKSDAALGAITLPETFSPGVYRARLQADGVAAVDFLVNIHNPECALKLDVKNGFVMADETHGLPGSIAYGAEGLTVAPKATLPGFSAQSLTLRHGHNLYGPQTIRGNRQWDEIEIPVGETTSIDASKLNGDILITGSFDPADDCEWEHIWGDEFNGTELDMDKWSYHPRYNAAWNRFIAQGDECPVVNKIGDGVYTAYCIPTPDEFKPAEKKEMISGAIYTASKFYCLNGYVEARIKTLPHKGNFPAFWMMPTTSMNWPQAGEIDIWEQINTENKAYQTIHSAWANPGDTNLGQPEKPSPTKSGNCTVDPAEYHIYALEWTQEALKFYVDGKLNFTYKNTHYSDPIYTEFLAWPFSKPFYIICNQSVGNGSWAAAPDTEFTYHTEFDYVRVYQRKDQLDYYSKADGKVSGIESVKVFEETEFDPEKPIEYYSLQGIRVNGNNLTPGIYILRQGTLAAKQIVK